MSDMSARHPITLRRLVHRIEGMEETAVERDVEYHISDAGPLHMDVYRPANAAGRGVLPVVLVAAGYRDVGVPRPLGCAFKEMEMVVSLGQLIAASGMAAVAYTTSDPGGDAIHAIDWLARHTAVVPDDAVRFGVWAASGNVPVALALLMAERRIGAAVLSNGFTLDGAGGSAVADAAATYRFVNASAGRSIRDLPTDVPLFVVRSGRDQFAGINVAMDRFTAEALARNIPLTVVNHATAPHAFELEDDSAVTRHILESALRFLRLHLSA